ncbi:FUSC family membrane protein [Plesiomonas shigelloides]|uniref:FUSC family membrane protein n=1 Tax=Plesiomonas shigelloides TaxID=703 RepID=UPI002247A5C4|nr:FUSC family membrane protein [Plesiomonas shigelloides]MCX2498963.1 FUSC family protein [Plesiomonas shigelloides]
MRSLKHLLLHPEFNFGLRQTLIVAIPVLTALALGNVMYGLLLFLSVPCCTVAGLDAPQQHYLRRVVTVAAIFASASLFVGGLLRLGLPEPLILLLLALVYGVVREISSQNTKLMPACLAAGILTLALLKIFPFWQAAGVFLIGVAWFGLFTFCWIHLWKFVPLRDTLNKSYRALADYLDSKYQILVNAADPEQASLVLLQKQQTLMELLSQSSQLLNQLDAQSWPGGQKMLRLYQTALDLQEHITSSLNQPQRVHDEICACQAQAVILGNVSMMVQRLRAIADSILYADRLADFDMQAGLNDLQRLQTQHPDSEVLHFCAYHFGQVARLLQTLRPTYERELCPRIPDPPRLTALKNYLNWNASSLRMAARSGVTLAIGAQIGALLSLPRSYWVLLTIVLVMQSGYNATKVRIQHRAYGTLLGLVLGTGVLLLNLPQAWLLGFMFIGTLIGFSLVHNHYGWAVVLLTVMVVCLLQLLTHNSAAFLVARMEDTLLGCVLAFLSTTLLWPQWQSTRLLQYANALLDSVGEHMHRLIHMLERQSISAAELSLSRIKVNQAQMDLHNSYAQALQEPGYNSLYLKEILLWQAHSQQLIEHINSMTVEIREGATEAEGNLQAYREALEFAIQACQQQLANRTPLADNSLQSLPLPSLPPEDSALDHHFYRILSHLSEMYALSGMAVASRHL